jgi:predicted NACHT family NTPase
LNTRLRMLIETAGRPQQLSALKAIIEQSRLVLLGDPGSRKSTFINFVGLCLAQAKLGESEWLDRLGSDWTDGALVPIRVELSEFADWLMAHAPETVRGEVALFWEWLESQNGTETAHILRQTIVAERALILLDGLDEVPADANGQPLATVRDIITSLSAVAGLSRILVTCRTLDYQQLQRQILGWAAETLIPCTLS